MRGTSTVSTCGIDMLHESLYRLSYRYRTDEPVLYRYCTGITGIPYTVLAQSPRAYPREQDVLESPIASTRGIRSFVPS